MPTIVAIAYPDQGTAEQAQAAVFGLEEKLVISAEQVAVISRDADGRFHVHTSHDGIPMAGGAIWGGFWGLLLGTLFLIPLAGWAIGAGVGARLGYLQEKGVGEEFQNQVRDHLKPGTSALFLVIDYVDPDMAIAGLRRYGGTVVKTTLSDTDAKKLQEALRPVAGAAISAEQAERGTA